jgi:hypothetical protein
MISKYLGDREFWRVTLSLAVPIAFQNLLISSFSLVDTIMVGQLGDIPLAAVGMAGQWSWLMGLVLFGLCSGSAVFVAQYWGINDRRSIQKVLGVSLCAVSFVALVFLLSGLFMPERIVGVFNSDKAVIAAGASYLRIACAGVCLRHIHNFKLRPELRSDIRRFRRSRNGCARRRRRHMYFLMDGSAVYMDYILPAAQYNYRQNARYFRLRRKNGAGVFIKGNARND